MEHVVGSIRRLEDMDSFCSVLSSAKCVGILTGAGLSAGSGIQTYRGVDGKWNSTDPLSVASLAAFQQEPGRVWRYFHAQRDQCIAAAPNVAHTVLASLSNPSVRHVLLPSLSDPSKPPLYITQNFDGLCRRALDACLAEIPASELDSDGRASAHERLIEMHGSCYKTICTQCRAVKITGETPLAEVLSAEGRDEDETIPLDCLPRCGGAAWTGSNRYGRCGGLLRPGVVWFGEVPEAQGEIVRNLTKVDVLLVIGTSHLVHPAASYAGTVKKNGGTVAVFNLGQSEGDSYGDFTFYGPCEETIPTLFERLGHRISE